MHVIYTLKIKVFISRFNQIRCVFPHLVEKEGIREFINVELVRLLEGREEGVVGYPPNSLTIGSVLKTCFKTRSF